MRLELFEALQPVCPVCRTEDSAAALKIVSIDRQEGNHVTEGRLECSNASCRHEYPIIDAIPVILQDLRTYLANNLNNICLREDLGADVESILGDCAGPSSAFNSNRQQLSSYLWDHYSEFDPVEDRSDLSSGSMIQVMTSAIDLADFQLTGSGPILDLGCGAGRSSFELAKRFNRPVLGIDLHFPMLKIASQLTRSNVLNYSRRRVGMVYDRRSFEVQLGNTEHVDFWACDATALPFNPASFSAAVSMNLLDCVHSPMQLLLAIDQSIKAGASAVVACPYDWSESATGVESWIGGHSQRGDFRGASDAILRQLLDQSSPNALGRLQLIAEGDFPWHVRLHERCTLTYTTHAVSLRKLA
ncbi:methyltransferase domain-containing protein [Stieleria sp. JC731]|uniref:methyltransferase domain-containing protein n=1 Tax=Pirellulaceae TaxID=2691357 RepID=UPI001E58D45B|nr:methyltransferase domain-containing protein [Stieleria sp. JC731]MCC9601120.1 methyltransferase domain-containing protein [Stieleria sp. JC731]